MITCPNCNHPNPEGALQCEACYTPLPVMVMCPSCNTLVQEDASFCGQCGADLRATATVSRSASATEVSQIPSATVETQNFLEENELGENESKENELEENQAVAIPDLTTTDPTLAPEPIGTDFAIGEPDLTTTDPMLEPEAAPAVEVSSFLPDTEASAPPTAMPAQTPTSAPPISPPPINPPPIYTTQLQVTRSRLRHAQTDTLIEIPGQLSVVRIGKPNDQTPPDIDVSGFPDSEVVSRVHANLRNEGDVYYIEDVGSSNGTYVNGLPLAAGNRHRLRPGDRIALGKGDKVSFIFESA